MKAVTRISSLLTTTACLAAIAFASVATAAPGETSWGLSPKTVPTYLPPGGTGYYQVTLRNLSSDPSGMEPVVAVDLPDGVTATAAGDQYGAGFWDCPGAVNANQFDCTLMFLPVEPYRSPLLALVVYVEVAPGATGVGDAAFTVAGGGAKQPLTKVLATQFSASTPPFEIVDFTNSLYDPDGRSTRQAGSHPDLVTNLEFPSVIDSEGRGSVVSNLKDVDVKLPLGLVGNPTVVEPCPLAQVAVPSCPAESQVGVVEVGFWTGAPVNEPPPLPVVRIPSGKGSPGRFAFNVAGVVTIIEPYVRADGEVGVAAKVRGASQSLASVDSRVTLWGVPADARHDSLRFDEDFSSPTASTAPRLPFMSAPTACTGQPLSSSASVTSWDEPEEHDATSSEVNERGEPVRIEGCENLVFSPATSVRPTAATADTPSGLSVDVVIPQSVNPDGLATSHMRDITMAMPKGLVVNPASADGLQACSPQQVGLTSPVGAPPVFNDLAVSCPDGSKLGTVSVSTPVLEDPIPGFVYLASQGRNPFGSLLALYIVLDDPQSGIRIKLAGQPIPDPETGQLRVEFKNNPQLPFERLEVDLFGGPRASLRTPSTCGVFETRAELVPWAAPAIPSANQVDSFRIDAPAAGANCVGSEAELPHNPTLSAGSTDPLAGAYSPVAIKVNRSDGTQSLGRVDISLPPGLIGRLAGTPYCSDSALTAASGRSGAAERAAASCPAATRVGSVTVSAGAGPNPLYVKGEAYLAGPYKGAPLSLAIVTPAVAGPFDLGTVVVRSAVFIDPSTAQVRAVSDPIPSILQGIPLDIRGFSVFLDKPSFTLNPTSCDPMSFSGSAASVNGASAPLSDRFQVSSCERLAFKPKLSLKLSGKTHRSAHPKLRATLRMPPGGANIARAAVTLPKTEFLAQEHIRTICTRVQYGAKSCPKAAIYGYAKAWSPLLDKPLEGPVYLRSSNNPLPDLVASLDGQIHIDLSGRIDTKNARIRNTFDLVPDAPVSKFVLTMQGGRKGLLVNNTELCKAKPRADVKFDGQNGKTADSQPLVKVDCGKKRKSGKK